MKRVNKVKLKPTKKVDMRVQVSINYYYVLYATTQDRGLVKVHLDTKTRVTRLLLSMLQTCADIMISIHAVKRVTNSS